MEQAMLWVTIVGIIVIPLVGWIFNTLITRKIDALEAGRKEDRELFFRRLDDEKKENAEELKEYVRLDLYKQAREFQERDFDAKFKSLLNTMTTQFENVEDKIEDLKTMFKEKFNNKEA